MTSNGHASGSTDGTPTISNRSTYPHDNWRSQSPRSAPGAQPGLRGHRRLRRPVDLASQPAGSRPRVSYPASSVAAPGHEPQRETMRHGCQDTARADTADWE